MAELTNRSFGNATQLLAQVTKRMSEGRRVRQDQLRKLIESAPIPLPNDLREQLKREHPADANSLLTGHPGFAWAERYRSYRTSVVVFERAFADLLCKIADFEEASRDGAIFGRLQQSELQQIEQSVQKELFAAASAAHSLVYHSTRRLNELAKIAGYSQRLTDCFGDDGLNEFIIEFRNVLHHANMVEAGWNVSRDYLNNSHSATFTVDKQKLVVGFEESPNLSKPERASTLARIEKFLAMAPDRIDIRAVFDEYRRRASEFYAWFSSAMSSSELVELRDYESCVREPQEFCCADAMASADHELVELAIAAKSL